VSAPLCRRRRAWLAALACCVSLAAAPSGALAQARTAPRRPAAEPTLRVRGFFEAGARTFTASKSFDAVLGSKSGPIFGAGGEVLVGRNLFVSFGVSRFQRDGERVVVFDDEAFPLGIDTTVSIVPIELSAGWRFTNPRRTVTPYVGAGLAWHRYKETSEFADDGEDAQFTKAGFQLLGGAEWRASRWLAVAGEAAWMSVPDAFTEPTSAAVAFGEDDLGGAVFRVKLVIGR
jgi:hypothetical protein